MDTVVHLIRHGEVDNPDNVRYGRAPGFHLSARGRAQARSAGQHLRALGRPIAVLVSSPLERAAETAAIIGEQLVISEVVTDERLIEAYNQLDGQHRLAFLQPRNWRQLRNPFVPSWAEPFSAIVTRMRSAVDDLRTRYRGLAIAAVSHQSPIWILRQSFERRGPPWLARVRCTQASVTSLHFAEGRYAGHEYWAPRA